MKIVLNTIIRFLFVVAYLIEMGQFSLILLCYKNLVRLQVVCRCALITNVSLMGFRNILFFVEVSLFMLFLRSSSETAIFYGDFSLLNSPQLSCVPRQWICCLGPCCVRHSITLDGLSSAKEVMDAVEYCRKTRLKDGPPVVNKAPIGFSAPEPSSTFQ